MGSHSVVHYFSHPSSGDCLFTSQSECSSHSGVIVRKFVLRTSVDICVTTHKYTLLRQTHRCHSGRQNLLPPVS